jgi:ATP-dependent DNA helicase RecG
LASQGESLTIEYKELLPDDEGSKRIVMKSVAAFANSDGGTILFGLTDDGEIKGLSRSESNQQARDRLATLVRTLVQPLPPYKIDRLPVPDREDRFVVTLEVEQGDNPPYAVGTKPTDYVYYVRRDSTSFPIPPNEVGALVRSRMSQVQPNSLLSPFVGRHRV